MYIVSVKKGSDAVVCSKYSVFFSGEAKLELSDEVKAGFDELSPGWTAEISGKSLEDCVPIIRKALHGGRSKLHAQVRDFALDILRMIVSATNSHGTDGLQLTAEEASDVGGPILPGV